MKTHLLILTVSLTAASVALGDGKNTSADEKALMQLEHEWNTARLQRDLSRTDRIVDPDWAFINPQGVLMTKETADENLKTGRVTFKSSKIDDASVKIYGDTAIVFSLVTQSLVVGGNNVDGQFRITDTYAKRAGQWRCVASQVTRFDARR
jgi:ketosteroid isomerase-like protein